MSHDFGGLPQDDLHLESVIVFLNEDKLSYVVKPDIDTELEILPGQLITSLDSLFEHD